MNNKSDTIGESRAAQSGYACNVEHRESTHSFIEGSDGKVDILYFANSNGNVTVEAAAFGRRFALEEKYGWCSWVPVSEAEIRKRMEARAGVFAHLRLLPSDRIREEVYPEDPVTKCREVFEHARSGELWACTIAIEVAGLWWGVLETPTADDLAMLSAHNGMIRLGWQSWPGEFTPGELLRELAARPQLVGSVAQWMIDRQIVHLGQAMYCLTEDADGLEDQDEVTAVVMLLLNWNRLMHAINGNRFGDDESCMDCEFGNNLPLKVRAAILSVLYALQVAAVRASEQPGPEQHVVFASAMAMELRRFAEAFGSESNSRADEVAAAAHNKEMHASNGNTTSTAESEGVCTTDLRKTRRARGQEENESSASSSRPQERETAREEMKPALITMNEGADFIQAKSENLAALLTPSKEPQSEKRGEGGYSEEDYAHSGKGKAKFKAVSLQPKSASRSSTGSAATSNSNNNNNNNNNHVGMVRKRPMASRIPKAEQNPLAPTAITDKPLAPQVPLWASNVPGVEGYDWSPKPGLSREGAVLGSLPMLIGMVKNKGQRRKPAQAVQPSGGHKRSPEAMERRTAKAAPKVQAASDEFGELDDWSRAIKLIEKYADSGPMLEAAKLAAAPTIGRGTIRTMLGDYHPGDEADWIPGKLKAHEDVGSTVFVPATEAAAPVRSLELFEIVSKAIADAGKYIPGLMQYTGAGHGRVDRDAPVPRVALDRIAMLHDSMINHGMSEGEAWSKYAQLASKAQNIPPPVTALAWLAVQALPEATITQRELDFVSAGQPMEWVDLAPVIEKSTSPPSVAVEVPEAIREIVEGWDLVDQPTKADQSGGQEPAAPAPEPAVTERVEESEISRVGGVDDMEEGEVDMVWMGFFVDTGASRSIILEDQLQGLALDPTIAVTDVSTTDMWGREQKLKQIQSVVEVNGVTLNRPYVASTTMANNMPVIGAVDIKRLALKPVLEAEFTSIGTDSKVLGVGKRDERIIWQSGVDQTADWWYAPDLFEDTRKGLPTEPIPYSYLETRSDVFNSALRSQENSAKKAWTIWDSKSISNGIAASSNYCMVPTLPFGTLAEHDVATNNGLLKDKRFFHVFQQVNPDRVMAKFRPSSLMSTLMTELNNPYENVAARAGAIVRAGITMPSLKCLVADATQMSKWQTLESFWFWAMYLKVLSDKDAELRSGAIPPEYAVADGSRETPAAGWSVGRSVAYTQWMIDGIVTVNSRTSGSAALNFYTSAVWTLGREGNSVAATLAAIPRARANGTGQMNLSFWVGDIFGDVDASVLPLVIPPAVANEAVRIWGRSRANMIIAFIIYCTIGNLFHIDMAYFLNDAVGGAQRILFLDGGKLWRTNDQTARSLRVLLPSAQQMDPVTSRNTAAQAQDAANAVPSIGPQMGALVFTDPPLPAPNTNNSDIDVSFNWSTGANYAVENTVDLHAYVASWLHEFMDPVNMNHIITLLAKVYPSRAIEGMDEFQSKLAFRFRMQQAVSQNSAAGPAAFRLSVHETAPFTGDYVQVFDTTACPMQYMDMDVNEVSPAPERWWNGAPSGPMPRFLIYNTSIQYLNAVGLGLVSVEDAVVPGSEWNSQMQIMPKSQFGQRKTFLRAWNAAIQVAAMRQGLANLPIDPKMMWLGAEYVTNNEGIRTLARLLWRSPYGSVDLIAQTNIVALFTAAAQRLSWGFSLPTISECPGDVFLSRFSQLGNEWSFGGGDLLNVRASAVYDAINSDQINGRTIHVHSGPAPFIPDAFTRYACAVPLWLVPLPNPLAFKDFYNYLTAIDSAEKDAGKMFDMWGKTEELELIPINDSDANANAITGPNYTIPISSELTRALSQNRPVWMSSTELFNMRLCCEQEFVEANGRSATAAGTVTMDGVKAHESAIYPGNRCDVDPGGNYAQSPIVPWQSGSLATLDYTGAAPYTKSASQTFVTGIPVGGRLNGPTMPCWNAGWARMTNNGRFKPMIASIISLPVAVPNNFRVQLGEDYILAHYQGYVTVPVLYELIGRTGAAIRNAAIWQLGSDAGFLKLIGDTSAMGLTSEISASGVGSGSTTSTVAATTPISVTSGPMQASSGPAADSKN